MNLLLDTHTFIWATASPHRLSKRVATLLSNPHNQLRLSAASVWEISLKHNRKREDFDFPEDLVRKGLESLGCEILPIEGRHALALFRLPPVHRDPFDRILIAQAWTDNLLLVTVDKRLEEYADIETVW